MTIFICVLVTVIFCVMIFNLKSPGKRIEHEILQAGALDSEVVIRSIGQLLGPPLIEGNKITHLQNGDEIFPEILKSISLAIHTITFETFIYWTGDIGKRLADALVRKANEGVSIHILLDWVGSRRCDAKLIEKMKGAGIQVERYRPLRWYNVSRLNNRTHRKILVIDGITGFTGGVGIADQWEGHAQDSDHWRDSHFKVEGPVVAQLQSAFLDNWNATRPEVLHGDRYFPKLTARGKSLAQVFKSSPEEGSGSVRLMYLYSIAHANKKISIANAYFVPDTHVRKMLIDARNRGVHIEVIVPGPNIDTPLTRRASRAVWGELLKAGVKIYEYQPTMFHCKYMIVDDIWVSVGSTNLDNRSFRLNDECNLNVVDPELAEELSEIFEIDKAGSIEMTLENWLQRPLLEKLVELLAHVMRSQV